MSRKQIAFLLSITLACILSIKMLGEKWQLEFLKPPSSSEASMERINVNPYCRTQPTGGFPPLDAYDMRLWNYDAAWHASHWKNDFSFSPWRAEYVTRLRDGDITLKLDNKGNAQIKSGRKIAMAERGIWEVEVTLPEMRDGVVVAPLWLYNETHRQEIDFEFAGTKSLDLSVHSYLSGKHQQTTVSVFKGIDFSNCTVRFKIISDIQAGWASMYVENVLVHRFQKEIIGHFPTEKMRPIIEMWTARDDHSGLVQWVGKWQRLPDGDALTMRVHGFRYSASTSDE